jgi:hypothetical protein
MRAWRSTVASFRLTLSNFFRCEVFERRKCRDCRIAAYFEPSEECAARVHKAGGGDFKCERYRLGQISPGPVRDDEYLNLIITDPQSVDSRSGKLLPVIVKQISQSGMSVLRDKTLDAEFETTFAELKKGSDARGKPRSWYGTCRFSTRNIRWNEAARQLGVYDTSLPGRRHHADVLAPELPRRELEALKKRVLDTIGPTLIAVADFRDGAFVRHGGGPAV